MKKLVVLISNSGTGSNLQAIIDSIQKGTIKAKIVRVISDKEDAYGLIRAKKAKIPISISQKKTDLLPLLIESNPDYVCLTGWKQIITDDVLDSFPEKILNIHPGLIPKTEKGHVKNPDGTEALWNKGKFTDIAIREFLNTKATYAGSSVHFLTHEFDFGPVLGRAFEKIQPDDTVDSLYGRLKTKEHAIYIAALQKLCNP